EHKAASYLIQPDPDDVFGPTEAVTSGVIGADFEDDDASRWAGLPMNQPASRPSTALEFELLWELAELGAVPYPLVRTSHGKTMDERAHLRRQVLADLARRGIVDGNGHLEPQLAGYFEVLAGGELTVDSVHIPDQGAKAVLAVVGSLQGRG